MPGHNWINFDLTEESTTGYPWHPMTAQNNELKLSNITKGLFIFNLNAFMLHSKWWLMILLGWCKVREGFKKSGKFHLGAWTSHPRSGKE